MRLPLVASVLAAALFSTGCRPPDAKSDAKPDAKSDTVTEGAIWSLEYLGGDGRPTGLTRVNDPKAIPGGNGSWNVDAYGRLTRDFLFITRPDQREYLLEVIPVARLVRVTFSSDGTKPAK
jgi:hypothetical protein